MGVPLFYELAAHLSLYAANQHVRSSALDEMISKLRTSRTVYQLLSSKLTVIEVQWCLSYLYESGRLQQVDDMCGGRLMFTPEVASLISAHHATGLHLIDDASVKPESHFREILAGLLDDKKQHFHQSIETYESLLRRCTQRQAKGHPPCSCAVPCSAAWSFLSSGQAKRPCSMRR
jgi:hypothetical protein